MPAITKENELAAWQLIGKVASDQLALYPTTYEEDVELLNAEQEHETLGRNKRNCVLYRLSEKIILHYLQDCSDTAEAMLAQDVETARAAIESWTDAE